MVNKYYRTGWPLSSRPTVTVQKRLPPLTKNQGCGSAFSFCGSGSGCFSQCGSGSNLKNFIKIAFRRIFWTWKRQKRLLRIKKKTMELVQIYLNFLIKLQLLPISLHFYCFFSSSIFPSWIRIHSPLKSQAIFLVLHSAQNALGFRQAQLGRKDTPVALMWRPLSEKYVCFLMITERSSVSALF